MREPFDSFDTTVPVSDEQLRSLVERGDAQQQVWAAWRLGLRRGSDAIPTLLRKGSGPIDQGVGRHLLIVLAGLGEQRLIQTIAGSEPDSVLLSEARVLVWRTARDHSEVTASIERWLSTEKELDALTRLLEMSPPLPLRSLRSTLQKLAREADSVAVRRLAWDKLIQTRESDGEIDWHRALEEPDPDPRNLLCQHWAQSTVHAEMLEYARSPPIWPAASLAASGGRGDRARPRCRSTGNGLVRDEYRRGRRWGSNVDR